MECPESTGRVHLKECSQRVKGVHEILKSVFMLKVKAVSRENVWLEITEYMS